MLKSFIVVCLSLFILTAGASSFPLDQYDLTEDQQALILRLEQRGIDAETLHRFAQNLENRNNATPTYIPPHTAQELDAVTRWAAGGAYAAFASNAGVIFDGPRYWDDCPNQALFNFGRATATQYLRQDVLSQAINHSHALSNAYARSPENFREAYLEMIRRTPFEQYLIIE